MWLVAAVYVRPDMSPEQGSCAQLPVSLLLNRGGYINARGGEEGVGKVWKGSEGVSCAEGDDGRSRGCPSNLGRPCRNT